MIPLRLVNNTGYELDKNLCFVNTALQLLNSIQEFREFFKNQEYKNNVNGSFPICEELSNIFRTDGKCSTSAAEVRRLVGLFSGVEDISDGQQKDISHFLRLLLQTLEIELSGQPEENFALINKFWGKEKAIRKFVHTPDGSCDKCHNFPRIEEENFSVLQLNIMQHVSEIQLTDLIGQYYSESMETIDMKCSSCCPHRSNCPLSGNCKLKKAVNQRILVRSPSFLIVQLLRFQNFSNFKIPTKVVSKNEITLPNLQKYELISIGDHLGPVIQNGHYVASLKYGNNWYRCNDEENYSFDSSMINTEHNYIFVYRKVTGPIIPTFIPTAEWKEVLPGQAIPGQCEARLNMSNGKSFARKLQTKKKGQHKEVNQHDKTKYMDNNMSSNGNRNDTEKTRAEKLASTKTQIFDVVEDQVEKQACNQELNEWSKIEKKTKKIECNTKTKVICGKTEKKKILCKSCKREFVNINIHLKKSFSCLPSYPILKDYEEQNNEINCNGNEAGQRRKKS